MKKILLTGIAGFIGSWMAEKLVERGDSVIGIDNFNNYYDPTLKKARAEKLKAKCDIYNADVSKIDSLQEIFLKKDFDVVCHFAAQAGVTYSLKNPFIYEASNNLGTLNLLELCRGKKIGSFIYASSSSVYGGNKKSPFSEADPVNLPLSIYAATKRYNELLAQTYSHLYGIHTTGLRFFTVYGPWGRPDMALFKFTDAILKGQPIDLFNNGKMKRDFTYVSDIVAGAISALDKNYPTEIFNLGNSHPIELNYFVELIEKELGKKVQRKYLEIQPGDVPETWADISKAQKILGYQPKVGIEEGVKEFIAWFRTYYKQ